MGHKLIAVVDGLKGFPEAINTALPETTVQTCIVHLIRNSLDFASWKDRKSVAAGSRKSTGHRRPKQPPWRWMRSIPARGVRNTPRMPHSGPGPGSCDSNLSAFLWARRLNSALSARLHKSLSEQDSKLVHR